VDGKVLSQGTLMKYQAARIYHSKDIPMVKVSKRR
jgi:hypothetical protein